MALRTPAFSDAKTFDAVWDRLLLEAALQEGVLDFSRNGTDVKPTIAAAGGLRFDIPAGAFLVKGDTGIPASGLSQGLFLGINDATVVNAVTLDAAHPTLPRLDLIGVRLRESQDMGYPADDFYFDKVTGVPTAGALLDNELGMAAVPNDFFLLRAQLVPAGATSLIASNGRDRRRWARGAQYTFTRNANAGGTGHYSTTSTSLIAVDPTNLAPRLEFSGVPVIVKLVGGLQNTIAANDTQLEIRDGSIELNGGPPYLMGQPSNNTNLSFSLPWDIPAPAPGSHKFTPYWKVSGGTSTLLAAATNPLQMSVREDLRQNASND